MTPAAEKVEVLSLQQTARLIRSKSVITVSGAAGNLVPDAVLQAIRQRFEETGEPRELFAVCPVAVGDVLGIVGLDRLADPSLLQGVVCGSYVYGRDPVSGEEPLITKLITDNRIHAYNFGIGVVYHTLRETAAGRPGLFTKVGLGTFQDPRQRGGRLNDVTPPRFASVCQLDGEEYLRYQLPPIDYAILRGTTADELGNISMEREAIDGGVFVQALAAHNNGGRVIVQVERLARERTLPPRNVVIPGVLVDAVVVAPGQPQVTGSIYDPYLSGEVQFPATGPGTNIGTTETIILDQVVKRLPKNALIILGFGIPSLLPEHPSLPAGIRFCIEHGAIGGLPAVGLAFGGSRNAEAIIDTPSMFDLIDGGGCDVACLGFSEVTSNGSVNVSRLPAGIPGSGGFTNIVSSTKQILFCGSFTAGGLKSDYSPGAVHIQKEGKFKKFVKAAREITFNPMIRPEQKVSYITDRCIIERKDGRLVITEVYPGIRLQQDILQQSEIDLEVDLTG